jgi:hypothetical protein
MSVNALLSTVILVAFIVTVVLAVGSYLAYKIRERSRAPTRFVNIEGTPIFFERVYPGRASQTPSADASRGAGGAA